MPEKNSAAENPLVMTRVFDAPLRLVFEVWTTAAHLEKWFGPNGFAVTATVEFRVGGMLRVRMVGHGMDHTVTGTYREIVPLERIGLSFRFDDVADVEFHQTITFAEQDGKTTLVMRQEFPPLDTLSAAHRALVEPRMNGSREGWTQTLHHLAEYLTR